MRLKDKVCVITGGGSGMGATAALMFSKEGAKVVVADVVEEAGSKTVQDIKAQGGQAIFVQADVSREADCKTIMEEGAKAFGGLDVLYNNAGIFPSEDGSVTDITDSVWQKVLGVNLQGLANCCKHGIPHLIKRGGGSVINTASFVALVGCSVPQDAYTASKGAVIALTKSLAVQFGPKHVRSNAICPGPIETPLLTKWLLANPVERNKRLVRIPMGRFGKAEDIAYLALYLASDESAWTNGAAIVVDGGITSNYF
jgi:NAD(P)-dependent dehydrogenase (short-subunit alcohol dehydrogenase family)